MMLALLCSTQPQDIFWRSTASTESNPPIEAQQTDIHSLIASLYSISKMSPLWTWRGDSWTIWLICPKLAVEHQQYFSDYTDIADVF